MCWTHVKETDLYVYISVDCFYVKYRDFMLEWSSSLPPKMPICLDLVTKLCSINNSSIHWKLTLSHWCHTVINYGDPDMIDNSLRSVVSGYLSYIYCSTSQTCVFTSCKEMAIFVNDQHKFHILVIYLWRWSPTLLKVVK